MTQTKLSKARKAGLIEGTCYGAIAGLMGAFHQTTFVMFFILAFFVGGYGRYLWEEMDKTADTEEVEVHATNS